jgi:TRAP-type mannitol/chloroaromatic compound transport system permease small subunit
VISGRFSKRTQIWIDVIGITCFLFPFIFMIIKLAMPLVINAYHSKEMSSNAGGLIRWPVYALLPAGLVPAGHPGSVGTDQAHRLPEGWR